MHDLHDMVEHIQSLWRQGQLIITPEPVSVSLEAMSAPEKSWVGFVLSHHQAARLASNMVVHYLHGGFEQTLTQSNNPKQELNEMAGLLQSFEQFELLLNKVCQMEQLMSNPEWSATKEALLISQHYMHTSLHLGQAQSDLDAIKQRVNTPANKVGRGM